ncbi:MAG: hypothetical protein AAGJ81_14005 [Verrucomicrobiota bacterium]
MNWRSSEIVDMNALNLDELRERNTTRGDEWTGHQMSPEQKRNDLYQIQEGLTVMVQLGIEAAQGAGIGCVSGYAPILATPRTSFPGASPWDGRGMSLSSVCPIGTGRRPASKRAALLRPIPHPAITINPS